MTKTKTDAPIVLLPGDDAQTALARYFAGVETGSRVINVRTMSELLGISVGAISNLVKGLQESGAVNIEKRGHMGSYLTSCSIAKIWEIVGHGPLVIATSLPMHVRFEGLATAIKKSLENAGVETYMTFIRGSKNRLKALHDNRCHAVVTSLMSALEIPKNGETVLYTLPSGSWLSGYRVFYRERADESKPLRVAVDLQSADHSKLTEIEFPGTNIIKVPASYVQVVRLLKKGEVDAIVWNEEQLDEMDADGIFSRPLSKEAAEEIGHEAPLSAAFVGKADADGVIVKRLLEEYLVPERALEIQRQVIDGKIFPYY